MKFSIFNFQFSISSSGQALITLLFFCLIAITLTSAAIIVLFSNSISGAKLQQGSSAYQIAQGGTENAMLRLLRDPDYTGEAGLVIGDGTADITVTGSGGSYTVTSKGKIGNMLRQMQAKVTYSSGQFVITSEKEIF